MLQHSGAERRGAGAANEEDVSLATCVEEDDEDDGDDAAEMRK